MAWTTGSAQAVSIGLTGEDTFQIAAAQGYGPKEQGGGGAELFLLAPVSPWLRLGPYIGLFETVPSDTTGGFVYRGYGTGLVGFCLETGGAVARWSGTGTLEAGGRIGMSADWAAYQYTDLYFFYPETLTEGFLGFRFAGLPSLELRLSLPIRFQFRRDLEYSFSAALSLGAVYTFGGGT